ncbi:Yip1 family protein [Heliorestis convoluta]|uniref:Yip1 domain-containing protein n=1 Tax=Heliorestis convoluta TaxID=356322 RepID=A0A5Q2MYN3_9FIRM|nr:Yip1 family protein [Heliorestis convoluta]QGG47081.1 hypothetical protein FTV88_0929 [Heliorestis convoluta]
MEEKKPPTAEEPNNPVEKNPSFENRTTDHRDTTAPESPPAPPAASPPLESPEHKTDQPQQEPHWTSWDYIYNVLAEPNKAFARASQAKPLGLAFAVIVISTLISLIVNLSMGPGDMTQLEQQGLPIGLIGVFTTIFAIVGAFFGLIMWFIMAGIYNLIGELLGGKGNAKGLLVTLGLASLPSIFTSPLRLLGEVLPGGATLEWLGILALTVWTIILQVFAIKQSVQLSTIRAAITYFAPLLLLLIATISLIVFILLTIPAIGSLPGIQ